MGGFKKMDVELELQAYRAKWGIRYLDPSCRDSWKPIVRDWLHVAVARWGLGDRIWTVKPTRAQKAAVESSAIPRFWVECLKAFWQLRVSVDPETVHGPATLLEGHRFMSVTLSGYSTVHYNRIQSVNLTEFSIKLAYWCLVRNKHKVPVPTAQGRWDAIRRGTDWPSAWGGIRNQSLTRKQEWRAWQLMHSVERASARLCRPCTCHCGHRDADMWHGLFECPHARGLWAGAEALWAALGGSSDVSDPMSKLTMPTWAMRDEVEGEIWRLICACIIDVLWIDWTRWAHQGRHDSLVTHKVQWRAHFHEAVTVLWMRAQRMNREYDYHIDYVPGCIWSQPRIDHEREFRARWVGVMGRVTGYGTWLTSAAL